MKIPFADIVDRYCNVFADRDRQLWAYIPVLSGCVPLHSSDFRDFFFGTVCNETSQVPSGRQFESVLHVLSYRARANEETGRLTVAHRVAEHCPGSSPEIIRLDLANQRDQFVQITASGFSVRSARDVYFQASHSSRALPEPQIHPSDPSAPLDTLRQLLNLASRADWLRCLAWLLACFRPTIPAPRAIFQGPPSSGKSLAATILRLFLDPSTSPFTPTPSSVRDLHSLVRYSYLLVFDRVSWLSSKVAAAISSLSAGIAISTRQPGVTQPVIQRFRRPVILTTTGDFPCPDSLSQDALTVHFAPLPPHRRKSIDTFHDRLKPHYPAILAALCHALATAIRRLPEIPQQEGLNPEMLAWALAAAPALGCTEQEMREALEYRPPDPTVEAVTHLFGDQSEWTGTATDLLHLLPLSPHFSQPKGVTQHLKKRLPAHGISIEFHRSSSQRLITLKLHPNDTSSRTDDRLPSSVEAPHDASFGFHPLSSAANSLINGVAALSGTDDRLPSSAELAARLGLRPMPRGHEQL